MSTCIQTVNELGLAVKGKKKPTDLNSIYLKKKNKQTNQKTNHKQKKNPNQNPHNSYAIFFPTDNGPILQSMFAQICTLKRNKA